MHLFIAVHFHTLRRFDFRMTFWILRGFINISAKSNIYYSCNFENDITSDNLVLWELPLRISYVCPFSCFKIVVFAKLIYLDLYMKKWSTKERREKVMWPYFYLDLALPTLAITCLWALCIIKVCSKMITLLRLTLVCVFSRKVLCSLKL